MANKKIFQNVPVKVQGVSGYDKTFRNLLTCPIGTLVPIFVEEVIPGTKTNLRMTSSVSLPPLASDTFMRLSMRVESYFVPMRLLVGSFQDWFTEQNVHAIDEVYHPGDDDPSYEDTEVRAALPSLALDSSVTGAGTLADYLGFSRLANTSWEQAVYVTPMPFLAYHLIYSTHYRNTLVQKDPFLKFVSDNEDAASGEVAGFHTRPGYAPYLVCGVGHNVIYNKASKFADGVSITSLRQRNFDLDYFTAATPSVQNGAASKVTFRTDDVSGVGEFSIESLRVANSLQQFRERNNLAGNLFVDRLKAQYGAILPDSIAQRPVCVNSASIDVYTRGIYQNAPTSQSSVSSNNPFSSIGAKYGDAAGGAKDVVLYDNFYNAEPGYLMVLASIVPEVTYGTGIRRYLRKYCIRDIGNDITPDCLVQMGNPILQNVGPQPILQEELAANQANTDSVFGYIDRYAEYKSHPDELHGLLRDGESLQSFALQRSYSSGSPEINSDFLKIPTTYLDKVSAVSGDVSEYGAWIDMLFRYGQSMPLAEYSQPTLQDPAEEHGQTVVLRRGGSSNS